MPMCVHEWGEVGWGKAAERKGGRRRISELMQPKAWRRHPAEQEEGPGLWVAEWDGEGHPT